jgi:hypothetical protein
MSTFLLFMLLLFHLYVNEALPPPETQVTAPVVGVPIVFFYVFAEASHHTKQLSYLSLVLEQAVAISTSSVYFITNDVSNAHVNKIIGVISVDTTSTVSPRTTAFVNKTVSMLQFSIWSTSMFRFLYLEDFMREYKVSKLLHIEGDNTIYGDITAWAHQLELTHPHLAATPLTSQMTTASVFWVGNLKALVDFNDYLLDLNTEDSTGHRVAFIEYLRRLFGKRGGLFENQTTHQGGVKPFAWNEMNMLGFYSRLPNSPLTNLPILPQVKLTGDFYGLGGKSVGGSIGQGGGMTAANLFSTRIRGVIIWAGRLVAVGGIRGFVTPLI